MKLNWGSVYGPRIGAQNQTQRRGLSQCHWKDAVYDKNWGSIQDTKVYSLYAEPLWGLNLRGGQGKKETGCRDAEGLQRGMSGALTCGKEMGWSPGFPPAYWEDRAVTLEKRGGGGRGGGGGEMTGWSAWFRVGACTGTSGSNDQGYRGQNPELWWGKFTPNIRAGCVTAESELSPQPGSEVTLRLGPGLGLPLGSGLSLPPGSGLGLPPGSGLSLHLGSVLSLHPRSGLSI